MKHARATMVAIVVVVVLSSTAATIVRAQEPRGAGAASATQPAASPTDQKKAFAAAAAQTAMPTEQHRLLEPFVGKFEQYSEVRLGPGEPVRFHSTSTGAWTIGGRYVRIDSASAADEEVKGERMTVLGYDPDAKKFSLWGIDSESLASYSATGDYDAATKTFTFDGERTGLRMGKMPFRMVFVVQDDRSIKQTVMVKPPGANDLIPVATVTHTRSAE